MSYLITEFDLSGRLQYFHIESNARDFSYEQSAVIRLLYVPRELDLPTEMSVIAALQLTHVAAFGGTDDHGDQWIVNIERAPAIDGTLLEYFASRSERLHTHAEVDAETYLSDTELRAIYAEAGAGPETEQIGFTSLLIGLQAEAFGYPLTDVVNNMNAQCAFPNDAVHDCDGSFFGDIGAAWVSRALHTLHNPTPDDNTEEGEDTPEEADGSPSEITLAAPDGSQWTYTTYHGDEYSPGETGWILTITGTRALDPQPVTLTDMLGDFDSMGLAETPAPELAKIFTEEIAESLRTGHVAAKKHESEPTVAQRLAQIEAELAEARGPGKKPPGADQSSGSNGGRGLPLMRPLKGQSVDEFSDDVVSAFRGFVNDAQIPDPSPEAADRRTDQARFGRWRHEQNLRHEELPDPAVDERDAREQP